LHNPDGSVVRPAPLLSARVRRWLLPWLVAVAALANLAYPMYVHFDFSHSPDTRSYLRMAAGRFDSAKVTHRYRVLVPAVAAAVNVPIAKAYARVWPQRPAGWWPLRFSFYLVNCLILAGAAACWFNAARWAGAAAAPSLLAVLAVFTSRWAAYASGLPLTDSLYLLVFGLAYYGAKRGRGAGWAIGAALLLGPLAKESFFILLPWLCWFGRPALAWRKQALLLTVGLLALAGVHHVVDSTINAAASASLSNALEHSDNLLISLRRAASPKGVGELLSVFGLFTFVIPAAIWAERRQNTSARWHSSFGWAEALLVLIVLVHMALSGDIGRMGYLASPLFCVALALIFSRYRQLFRL